MLRWDKDKAPSCFYLLAKLNLQLLKVWQSLPALVAGRVLSAASRLSMIGQGLKVNRLC